MRLRDIDVSSGTRRRGGLAGAVLLAGLASAAAIAYKTQQAESEYPPRGKFLTVGDVRLHYIAEGVGAPVVLLHGNGAMTDDLRISGLFDAVARNRRVIAYDRPGFGHTGRPRQTTWSPAAQATLFADANAMLGLERPIIVGHSWGALVALALALDHPDRIGGLVLVSGFYFPEIRVSEAPMSPAAWPVLGDILNHTVSPWIGAATAHASFKGMFAPQSVPARFTREFPVALTLRPSQIKAFAEEATGMVAAARSICERYRDLRTPTTIIAGDADTIVDVSQAKRLHAAVPASKLVIIPGASHMLHHRYSEEIARAITDIQVLPPGTRIAEPSEAAALPVRL